MSGQAQLVLEPMSGRFDNRDERWSNQVTALLADLRRAVGDVSSTAEPLIGTKGAVGSIVLSVLSASSVTAMIELFKAWLARDRTRSLKVSWSADRELQSVELAGSRLDDAAFDELLQAVLRQVAGER